MNKKAQTNKTILGLIMLIILIAFFFYIYRNNIASFNDIKNKKLSPLLTTRDYDGDGFPDLTDVCPCGSDNARVSIEGKDYCATMDRSKESCVSDYFEWHKYSAPVQGGRCLYEKEKCLLYISNKYTSE